MSLLIQQNPQTEIKTKSHILRVLDQQNKPKCTYHGHFLYTLNHDQLNDLINPKKWLGDQIVQHDLITPIFSTYEKGTRMQTKITDEHKIFDAFNNIIFKFKIDNDTKEQIQIEKIFEWIEVQIGGQQFDKIYGTSIKALLNLYKLVYHINNDIVYLPIPFGITSNDNVIVNKIIPWYECRICFKIGTEYNVIQDSLEMITTHYAPIDPTKTAYFKKNKLTPCVELLNLFEENQTMIYNSKIGPDGKIKINLHFGHPIFEMIFYFVDKEKNILTEKLFKSYYLYLDGERSNYDISYDFVKGMSTDLPDGFYRIGTKNLLCDRLECDCPISKEIKQISNFSRIDVSHLIIDPVENFDSSKYEIIVMAINVNVLIYNEDKYVFDTMYKN